MAGNRTIEVAVPDGASARCEDLETLRGIFDAIVALGCPGDPDGIERALTGDGWTVRARLMWVAEARRGGEYQEVSGASRAEALRHLQQLVRADQVLSPP